MAGTAYNIKKYLKYMQKLEKTLAKVMTGVREDGKNTLLSFFNAIRFILSRYPTPELS
ncbi:MAG: hypothetical protein ACI9FU_001275 [Granulosicoccus sp.]|jgi:uncharacterized protein YhaN